MIKVLIEYKVDKEHSFYIKIYEIKRIYFFSILIYTKINNKIKEEI